MKEPNYESDGIVLVPVPVPLLPVVYGALSAAMPTAHTSGVSTPVAAGAVGVDRPDGPAVLVQDNGWWTPAMVGLLRAEMSRYRGAKAALDLAAKNAPSPVSIREVEKESGSNLIQVRAELAALTKVAKRLFGRKAWPMRARWGLGGEDCMYYAMDEEVAGWWLDQ
jgi:hypothetical protein